MRRQDVLHIFGRDLALRDHAPGKIVALRGVIRIRSVPDISMRVEIAQHIPRTRCVIYMVCIIMASKRVSRIQGSVQ